MLTSEQTARDREQLQRTIANRFGLGEPSPATPLAKPHSPVTEALLRLRTSADLLARTTSVLGERLEPVRRTMEPENENKKTTIANPTCELTENLGEIEALLALAHRQLGRIQESLVL